MFVNNKNSFALHNNKSTTKKWLAGGGRLFCCTFMQIPLVVVSSAEYTPQSSSVRARARLGWFIVENMRMPGANLNWNFISCILRALFLLLSSDLMLEKSDIVLCNATHQNPFAGETDNICGTTRAHSSWHNSAGWGERTKQMQKLEEGPCGENVSRF